MSDTCPSPVPAVPHEDEWKYQLKPGDEVVWNDPDGGLCTATLIIKAIQYRDDHVLITDTDGDTLECFLKELSRPEPVAALNAIHEAAVECVLNMGDILVDDETYNRKDGEPFQTAPST